MQNGSDINTETFWALASEEPLSRLTELACRSLNAPRALVSYVTSDGSLRSASGLAGFQTDSQLLDMPSSLCRRVIASNEAYLANCIDAPDLRDPAQQDQPPQIDAPIAAYIGVPIRNAEGRAVGSLCVYDHEPRQWNAEDGRLLAALADASIAQIERGIEAGSRRDAELALRDSESRFSAIANNIPGVIFERRKRGDAGWTYRFLRLVAARPIRHQRWSRKGRDARLYP